MFINDHIMIDTAEHVSGSLITAHQDIAADTTSRSLEFKLACKLSAFLKTPTQLLFVGFMRDRYRDITEFANF